MIDHNETLRMALVGYRLQVQEIEQKMAAIRADLERPERQYRIPVQLVRGGNLTVKPAGKRKLSAAAIERIKLGQKRRWQKFHAAQKKAA